ncbi:MAG TPA: MarR family transcriptional regulator [Kofleriaceae bacterium]|jgi:DNA-binding MarR family transcriptional regulator
MNPAACNCFALRAAARHVTAYYDQALAGLGIKTTQYSILSRLRRLGPMSINALATELVLDRTTLGRTILPLERDKYLTISPSPDDGRSKVLTLSPAGKALLARAELRWAEAQLGFEKAFGKARASELRDILGSVVETAL